MKTRNKIIALIGGCVVIAYLVSPYYSAWKIMQAVKSGDAEQMKAYIDFARLRASVKQQIDSAMERKVQQDPIAAVMMKSMSNLIENLAEDILRPEKLAQIIQSGKLDSQQGPSENKTDRSKVTNAGDEMPGTESAVSWYAFFDRPDRFRIAAGDLVVYLELRDWRWKMTAIGIEDLIDSRGEHREREFVADEIDTGSLPPPVAVTDLARFEREIAEAFFIVSQWGSTVNVEGDFYYMPGAQGLKPTVTWLDARDTDGNPVLGEFSEEELAEREKYNKANRFYRGRWSDVLPRKPGPTEVASATGLCRIEVPTRVDSITLGPDHLKKLQHLEHAAVILKSLRNGEVSLSYYTPYDKPEIEPVIVVRNAAGLALETPGSFSMSPQEPVESDQFDRPMRAKSETISVSGTPQSVEIYFPFEYVTVENEFTAIRKPSLDRGELKTPLTRTRYTRPLRESRFIPVDADRFLNGVEVSLRERTNNDDTKSLYIELIPGDGIINSYLLLDTKNLEVSWAGKAIKTVTGYWRMSDKYQITFSEYGGSGERIEFDRVQGVLEIRYPVDLEIVTVRQGESRNGIELIDSVLTYPADGDFFRYNGVFEPRPVIAYGKDNRQIMLLEDASIWSKTGYRLVFWGSPDYVKLKAAKKWYRLKIPIDLGLDDVQPEAP